MSEHNDSASPEQHDTGFAEGEKVIPRTHLEEEASEGRFSEGQELLPDSPEKHKEGSFAEGQEVIDPTHGPG